MIYHQLKPIPNEYFPFQSNVIWLLRGISILDLVSDGIKCDCPSALYQNKSSSHHVMAFYPFIAVKWNLNFRESRAAFLINIMIGAVLSIGYHTSFSHIIFSHLLKIVGKIKIKSKFSTLVVTDNQYIWDAVWNQFFVLTADIFWLVL